VTAAEARLAYLRNKGEILIYDQEPEFVLPEHLQKGPPSMMDKFRAVARQSYLDMGMPKVGREVIGLYSTRKEAEDACIEFVKSRGDSFRTAYDDCIVELVRSS
jgi:hypothetical protein